jgi:hypothetical protein
MQAAREAGRVLVTAPARCGASTAAWIAAAAAIERGVRVEWRWCGAPPDQSLREALAAHVPAGVENLRVAAFEPLREPHGDTIETVLANDDWLDIELAGYDPETTTVTVAVYPDSYAAFRKLKEKIYAKGYATAARPIAEDRPIYVNFSGGGSRSVAQ